jgi:hypothetical protein
VHSANSKSIIIDSKFQHKIFSIELKAADFNFGQAINLPAPIDLVLKKPI